MGEFVGADPRQLTELAKKLKADGETIASAPAQIAAQLHRSTWKGPDADAFRSAWSGKLTPQLGRAAEALRGAASDLLRNAVEQDQASGSFDAANYGGLLDGESWSDVINWVQGGGFWVDDLTAEDLGGTITVGDPESVPVDGPEAQEQFADLSQVNQGSIGDCWLISALAAVGHSDPQWIDDHIDYVDGAWEVTLYENGEPVTIRVEPDSLVDRGARDGDESVSWMSIYEQAVAQHLGGDPVDYNSIVADSTTRGFELITGSAGSESILPPSMEDLSDALGNGQPITGMTDPIHPWRDDLVAAHVYIVSEVDVDAGTVTVVNPWGPGPYGGDYADVGDTITMSYADYQANFIMTGVGDRTGGDDR